MKRIGILSALVLAAAIGAGCVSTTATRSVGPDGKTTSESIKVTGFLERIQNGQYTTADGMSLSVSDATPDQQSIATLSGGVVDMGKTALLLYAKSLTNAVGTNAAKP